MVLLQVGNPARVAAGFKAASALGWVGAIQCLAGHPREVSGLFTAGRALLPAAPRALAHELG